MAGVTIPTGFETQQALIALRQKLADAMLEQGMTPQQGMRSPLQVLGQMAQMAAGGHLEHQALSSEKQLNDTIRQTYLTAHQKLADAIANHEKPDQVLAEFGSNPFLADDPLLKGMSAGFSKGQETGQEFHEMNGVYGRNTDFEGQRDTGNPVRDKTLVIDGNIVPNLPVIAAEQAASPFNQAPGNLPRSMPYPSNLGFGATPPASGPSPAGVGVSPSPAPAGVAPSADRAALADTIRDRVFHGVAQVESGGRDFYPDGRPVINPQSGAKYMMQVLDSTAHNPGFGVRPAANDSPTEYDRVGRDYLAAMMSRYHNNLPEALGAYNAGPGTMDRAIAAGGPLPAQSYASKAMAAMGSAPSSAPVSSLPQVGERRGQYMYVGGDPNDQNSWKLDL